MQRYVGKICPYCRSEFTINDDIVICSECDMPHHKDCWIENQVCTTFGCLGTIQRINQGQTSVTTNQMNYDEDRQHYRPAATKIYCARCGAPNLTTYRFCSKCGAAIVHTNTTFR